METIKTVLWRLKVFLETPLFKLGEAQITLLSVLFERPVRIGDRIAVGDIEGDVVRIGARSTTVLTNDNIDIIIPNSKLITENVVNWTHGERKVRFRIPVSVA